MLNENKPCEDLLVQLSAIKAALNQITIKLLEGHIEVCVTDFVRRGDMETFERFNNALRLVLKNQ
jgi:DNA-binding FrmR family transcriptional regulator